MPVTPSPDGATSRLPDRRLDGRLDLDDLDAALDLGHDVVGEDGAPGVLSTLGTALRRSGVNDVLMRHRALVATGAIVVSLTLVAGGIWAAVRPVSLDDAAHITVVSGGGGPPSITVDTATGEPLSVSQLVLVTSTEPEGIRSDVLGVQGPGLADGHARIPTGLNGAVTTGPVWARIDCATDAAVDSVLAASAADYTASVRRTTTAGASVVSQVPLASADDWHGVVRTACVQGAADRDLQVTQVVARPRADVVAVDLDLDVANASDHAWSDLRVAASTAINANGLAIDVPARSSAHLLVHLWPSDCATPIATLASGLALTARFGGPSSGPLEPQFRLALDEQVLRAASVAAAAVCRGPVPTLEIERAYITRGHTDDSDGTIDVFVRVHAPGASRVDVAVQPDSAVGRMTANQTPVLVRDGTAELQLTWTLPRCTRLLSAGGPRVHLLVTGSTSRPFSLRLRGESLKDNLTRQCPDVVAGIVG